MLRDVGGPQGSPVFPPAAAKRTHGTQTNTCCSPVDYKPNLSLFRRDFIPSIISDSSRSEHPPRSVCTPNQTCYCLGAVESRRVILALTHPRMGCDVGVGCSICSGSVFEQLESLKTVFFTLFCGTAGSQAVSSHPCAVGSCCGEVPALIHGFPRRP